MTAALRAAPRILVSNMSYDDMMMMVAVMDHGDDDDEQPNKQTIQQMTLI